MQILGLIAMNANLIANTVDEVTLFLRPSKQTLHNEENASPQATALLVTSRTNAQDTYTGAEPLIKRSPFCCKIFQQQ